VADNTDDFDPIESQEWQDAIEDVIVRDGPNRAHYLLDRAVSRARAAGANLPFSSTTPYQNTIPTDEQPPFPGDAEMEWRIRTINRWNAMATVVRRNKESSEYGGHIASFASSAAPVFTRVLSWKGVSPKRSLKTSVPKLRGAVCRPIAQPRPDRHGRPQGLGLPWRRGNGRA